MKKRNALKTIIVLAISVFCFQLQADDKKNYSASSCQRVSGGVVNYTSHGWLYNSSTSSSLKVSCPLVKDNMDNALRRGFVMVKDRNSSYAVECWLKSRWVEDGSSGYWGYTMYDNNSDASTGNSNNWRKLDFGGAIFNGKGYDTVNYYCSIPPKGSSYSYIASYSLTEK